MSSVSFDPEVGDPIPRQAVVGFRKAYELGAPKTAVRSDEDEVRRLFRRDSPGSIGAGVLRRDAHSCRAGNGTESPKRLIMGAPHRRGGRLLRELHRVHGLHVQPQAGGRRGPFSPAFPSYWATWRRAPSSLPSRVVIPDAAPRKSLIACRFFRIGGILIDREVASHATTRRRHSASWRVPAGVKKPVRAGV